MRTSALVFLLAATVPALAASEQTSRNIRVTTPDDVGIVGTYYPAESPTAPAILLLHDLGQSRTNWAAFATLLQENGFAALAIDLRGHGDSNRRLTATGAELLDAHAFVPRDFQDMLIDVNSVANWLENQPGANPSKTAVIGSGLGANLALRYATFNEDLGALILLSPGINYRGLRTDDVINKVGNVPLRVVVARFDAFASESAKRLVDMRKEAGHGTVGKELWVSTGNLHGIEMISGVKTLPARLVGWLKEVLLGAPPEPVEDRLTEEAAPPPAPAPAPAARKPGKK